MQLLVLEHVVTSLEHVVTSLEHVVTSLSLEHIVTLEYIVSRSIYANTRIEYLKILTLNTRILVIMMSFLFTKASQTLEEKKGRGWWKRVQVKESYLFI